MASSSPFRLRIASLLIEVQAAPGASLSPGPEYAPFLVEDPKTPDLRITFGPAQGSWFDRGERLFQAHNTWELLAGDPPASRILRWAPQGTGPFRCEAKSNGVWSEVDVWLDPWPGPRTLTSVPNVLEVAFQTRLARSTGGFLLHALGLDLDGVGVLLPGSSGRGKSTLSGLFPAETLSDERVALAPVDGEWWIHGTPWRGTANRVRAHSVPLGAVSFLGPHEPPWGATLVSRVQAFQRLAFHGFPPFWDRTGLEAVLATAQAVANDVTTCELRHQPQPEVREVLNQILRQDVTQWT